MRIVVEEDAILRAVPVVLDPRTAEEHCRATADFYEFDEPDFPGWLARVRQQIPGLFPAEIVFARDEADLIAKIVDADALIVESFLVNESVLAHAGKLKIVQKFGGVAPNIDAAACLARGVRVSVQRRRVNIAVAEQAMALMLALAKRICDLKGVVTESALRGAGFDIRPFDRRYTGNSNFARIRGFRTLAGSVLGILGLGEIGREIAARATAFGMTVLYHQRHRIDPVEEGVLGARYVSLDALMTGSDFIAPALPMNASTRGIIGPAQLQRVKPGALLINVTRAELVDHDALVDALKSGRLGGFALDVGYKEPTPLDEPLLSFTGGNVILMPHTAVAERRNNLDDMEEMCLKLWRGTVGRVAPLAR
ncbi:MAG TPA: NAD(P)-dependent oxidoreductase [Stellaceae bacterium]|nr:NAD(P)-dependent oxidoreductase [Stellaceae bacterium]